MGLKLFYVLGVSVLMIQRESEEEDEEASISSHIVARINHFIGGKMMMAAVVVANVPFVSFLRDVQTIWGLSVPVELLVTTKQAPDNNSVVATVTYQTIPYRAYQNISHPFENDVIYGTSFRRNISKPAATKECG